MLAEFEIGPWRVECDAEATAAAYARVAAGGSDECECDGCRNWAAQRESVLAGWPFGRLGIAPEKDAEIYHAGKLPSGLHLYGGWWHFVGRILKEKDAVWTPSGAGHLRFLLLESCALVPPAFEGQPLVQLEIDAEVPWVLDGPEPR